MYTLEQLNDIEEIKILKHRYIRYGDIRDWEKWAELFVDDYVCVVEGVPRMSRDDPTTLTQRGIKEIARHWETELAVIPAIHRVYMPEITLTGPTTATGIWGLNDVVYMPTNRFEGWGHYHEQYVKVDGVWRYQHVKITRLRVEETWYDEP